MSRPAGAFVRHVAVGSEAQPALLAPLLTPPGVDLNGPLT
jgi:hypothetical protein